jgi:hypothetical protein
MSALVYGDSLRPLYLGDGSLNTTLNSYNSKIYRNNTLVNAPSWTFTGNNIQPIGQAQPPVFLDHTVKVTATAQQFLAGTNTYTFNATNPIIAGNRVVNVIIQWGAITGSRTFQSFQVRLNGTLYSLSDAVANNLIRPWVGLVSFYPALSSPQYVCNSPLNFYTGVSTCTGLYSYLDISFILNSSTTMDAIRYNVNASSVAYLGDYIDGHIIRSNSYTDYPITITR